MPKGSWPNAQTQQRDKWHTWTSEMLKTPGWPCHCSHSFFMEPSSDLHKHFPRLLKISLDFPNLAFFFIIIPHKRQILRVENNGIVLCNFQTVGTHLRGFKRKHSSSHTYTDLPAYVNHLWDKIKLDSTLSLMLKVVNVVLFP